MTCCYELLSTKVKNNPKQTIEIVYKALWNLRSYEKLSICMFSYADASLVHYMVMNKQFNRFL